MISYGVRMTRDQLRDYVNRWIDSLHVDFFGANELTIECRADVRDATRSDSPNQVFEPTGGRSLVVVFKPNGEWAGADGPPVRNDL